MSSLEWTRISKNQYVIYAMQNQRVRERERERQSEHISHISYHKKSTIYINKNTKVSEHQTKM